MTRPPSSGSRSAPPTLPAAEAHASYDILGLLSVAFGIPFSIVALGTGIALGLGTRWGTFRYPWVIAKLALLASLMVVGGVALGPAEDAALDGSGTGGLIAGAVWDLLAISVAIGLSVFEPGRALGSQRRTAEPDAAAARPHQEMSMPTLRSLAVLALLAAVGTAPVIAQAGPATTTDVAGWVSRHAVPVATTEPTAPLDDLDPLRRSIGDARGISSPSARRRTVPPRRPR